jgi:hypothetical protein
MGPKLKRIGFWSCPSTGGNLASRLVGKHKNRSLFVSSSVSKIHNYLWQTTWSRCQLQARILPGSISTGMKEIQCLQIAEHIKYIFIMHRRPQNSTCMIAPLHWLEVVAPRKSGAFSSAWSVYGLHLILYSSRGPLATSYPVMNNSSRHRCQVPIWYLSK